MVILRNRRIDLGFLSVDARKRQAKKGLPCEKKRLSGCTKGLSRRLPDCFNARFCGKKKAAAQKQQVTLGYVLFEQVRPTVSYHSAMGTHPEWQYIEASNDDSRCRARLHRTYPLVTLH